MNTVITKGILCAIDFSESSRKALKWAVSLAKETESHLTILFTYRLFASNGEALSRKREIEKDARARFEAMENEFLLGGDVSYEFRMEVGFVADRVRDFVSKQDASFVVMGNKTSIMDRESFDDLLQGSRIPVVIVP